MENFIVYMGEIELFDCDSKEEAILFIKELEKENKKDGCYFKNNYTIKEWN